MAVGSIMRQNSVLENCRKLEEGITISSYLAFSKIVLLAGIKSDVSSKTVYSVYSVSE